MWEETFDDIDLASQPKGGIFNTSLFKEKIDTVLVFLIIISSAFILIISLKFRIFHLWADFLQSNTFLRISTIPLFISGGFIIAGLIFKTILWFRYKPQSLKENENIEWPFVSVIMPALNEEELIKKSIDSIFASTYPKEKIEVICINDGSKDRTYLYMLRAKYKYNGRLKVINFKENMGKRKALYVGLKQSKGEIIVTVDSDSKIGRSAIRNLVIPLLKDGKTGAVSGRVGVLNEKENFLTRMLSVRYSLAFDFGRAYQSNYGAVFCCPGALTAYRKSVLQLFIKDWVNQEFLNTKCTYGEDRALTTNILKAGYMTRFQSNAVVYTKVPTSFGQMNKMYLRWTRSYIRESILFAQFMFSRYRTKHRVLPIFDFLFINILHPFHIFTLAIVTYSFLLNPLFIVRHLAFLVISSFFFSLYYLRSNKSIAFLYGIPYGIITAFCLWWIVPVAAFSLKNQSWLTR
ncbi:MAG: glycosyltransferase [Candidatus Aminicenantaceae bacterium]